MGALQPGLQAVWRLGAWAALAALLTLSWAAGQQEPQCAERGLDFEHPLVASWGGREPQYRTGWGQKCIEYRKVCFDQETVVSFDPAHSPANFSAVPIPQLNISTLTYVWGGQRGVNGDVNDHASLLYPPLAYRPASAFEGSPDLQQPRFSNCSVPLVMWGLWSAHNLFEFFVRAPVRMWTLQQAGALSNRATLVIGSPPGERLPQFASVLLQPFTPFEVVSFSEFSQRNTPADAPRTTAEGAGQRCFERAYLCAWQVGYIPGIWSTAEAIARHYAVALPVNPLGFDSGPEVLKVLIESRQGPVRNILNARQLVDECNSLSGSWALDRASPIQRIQCRFISFGSDPARDLMAAASADVLVAVHGAGCTNWLVMNPGSALLEIRPYGFGSHGWADRYFPSIAAASNLTRFHYALNVEGSQYWKPGAGEVARGVVGRTQDPRLLRDRHVLLPLDALKAKLLRIAAAGRSQAAYLAQRAQQLHYSDLGEDSELHRHCPPPKLRPATGPCSQSALGGTSTAASGAQTRERAAAPAAERAAEVAAAAAAADPAGAGAADLAVGKLVADAASQTPTDEPAPLLEDEQIAVDGAAAASPAAELPMPGSQPATQPAVPPVQHPGEEKEQQQAMQPSTEQQQQQQQHEQAVPQAAAADPADAAALLGSTPALLAVAATSAVPLPVEVAPAGLWNGRALRGGPPGLAMLSAIALLAAATAVWWALRRRRGKAPPRIISIVGNAEAKPLTAVSAQLPVAAAPNT